MLRFKSFLLELNAMYNPLKHNDLTRRAGRIDVFINKIKDGEYFMTTKGAVKITAPSPNDLEVEMPNKGFSKMMAGVSDKGRRVTLKYPNDFFKTPEFGGKGAGSGTAAEDAALTNFRRELTMAMQKTGMPYVNIKVNGRVVQAVNVVSTPGTPKSDFHLVDAMGNEVAWISHKDGRTSKDFQQWGGLTELRNVAPNHPEIESFIDAVRADSPNGLDGSKSYARVFQDKKLKMLAVYGIDFGKRPGRQNVDVLLQGPIKLRQVGKNFVLTSNHTMENGTMPDGGYTPQLFVRKGDRSNFGIANARFMVAPKDLRRRSTVDI